MATPNLLFANHQGSIVAYANYSGVKQAIYTYGPWGEPTDEVGNANWTGPRFRYTGQVALPEVRLYYYKARVYDPVMGRFLQTDPIGSEDDLNLYAYVAGDPVNRSDPTGLANTLSLELGFELTPGVGIKGSAGWLLQLPSNGESWSDPNNYDVGYTTNLGVTAGAKGDVGMAAAIQEGGIPTAIDTSVAVTASAGPVGFQASQVIASNDKSRVRSRSDQLSGAVNSPINTTSQAKTAGKFNVLGGPKVGIGLSGSIEVRGTISGKQFITDRINDMKKMFDNAFGRK